MQRVRLGLLLAILAQAGPVHAQGAPSKAGTEFQINTYTTGAQRSASLAVTGNGDFVVVWHGPGPGGTYPVSAQIFDASGAAAGTEFQVNAATTEQNSGARVAVIGTGGFIVVWSQAVGGTNVIDARRFDSAGAPLGSEFLVNTYTDSAVEPDISVDPNGRFVVVWQASGDGSGMGVFARRFNATGAPLDTTEFQVNTFTTADQLAPSIASAGSSFIVVWEGESAGDTSGVSGRRFDSSGAPLSGEFLLNTTTTGYQYRVSVAGNSTGDFVVTWTSSPGDADPPGVLGQRFGANGNPKGQDFLVNTYQTHFQTNPGIAMNAAGDFVVVWESELQDGSGSGIFGQAFRSSGSALGGEFQVNTFTSGYQLEPSVGIDALGNFAVGWSSYGADGDSYAISGQLFCSPGQDKDGDGVCDTSDNCPNDANPGQSDADADGLGDVCDVFITSPTSAQNLDCTDPNTTRPPIVWSKGNYDKFRVFLSGDAAFTKAARVSSGKTLLVTNSYSPTTKKWKRACGKAISANPSAHQMFIRVFGVDAALPSGDPNRKTFSQVVNVGIIP